MKKTILLFLLLLFFAAFYCKSQSFVTLDGAQVFSNFKFTANDGKVDKSYTSVSSGGYSLGYRLYQKPSGAKEGKRFGAFFMRANLGMRKGGATLLDNNSIISWNLQYADLRVGAGYEIDKWRVKPYLSVAPYYSVLLKAYQNVDGLSYDLKKDGSLKTSDAGILVVPGVKAYISEYFSIYSEFSYLLGLQNIETSTGQKLNNRGFFLTLGLAATITKSKPTWLQ